MPVMGSPPGFPCGVGSGAYVSPSVNPNSGCFVPGAYGQNLNVMPGTYGQMPSGPFAPCGQMPSSSGSGPKGFQGLFRTVVKSLVV